jgi:hypothetical protein
MNQKTKTVKKRNSKIVSKLKSFLYKCLSNEFKNNKYFLSIILNKFCLKIIDKFL